LQTLVPSCYNNTMISASPGKLALITGATTGIGYELAKLFAQDHYDLVLVARDEARLVKVGGELKEKHGVSVKVIAEDLSLTGSPQEIFSELERQSVMPDVLVNNAGYGFLGPFADSDLSVQTGMIQVNLVALTQLTRLFLPGMISRKQGRILNVASTAAFQPGPLMAVYYATKAYVLSFSEALNNELHGTGVTVTALCPGPAATEFQRRAGVEKINFFSGRSAMAPEKVAQKGYRALMQGKAVVITGFRNKFLAFSERFLPRSVVVGVVRGIHEQGRNPK
jgi:short-subunit dehydrogenase